MRRYIPIFLTATCVDLFESDPKPYSVTVLVPSLDELLHGPPDKSVAVEVDGDIFYTMKSRLSEFTFSTAKGTTARPMVECPGSGGRAVLSDYDRSIIQRIRAGENGIVLDRDDDLEMYILPALLPDGRIEYQVSNGLDGNRGESFDFYCYRDAKRAFKGIIRLGWDKWARTYTEER